MAENLYFRYPLEQYKRDFNFIPNYVDQMAIGLSISENISVEEAKAFINEEMSSGNVTAKIPNVHCTHRQKNGDRIVREAGFQQYFDMINGKGLSMSPTLTTYLPPHVEKSFSADSIADDMAARGAKKKLALVAKQKDDKVGVLINNGLQNAIKVYINSWSGAASSSTNPFYCKSSHPSLTSTCRITTATCTAVAERFVAGKRWYYNPEVILEDILFTLKEANKAVINNFIRKNNIYIPTVQDVKDVIWYSARFYILDINALSFVFDFVSKMSPIDRAIVVYTLDYYHLAKYNDSFARELVETFVSTDIPSEVLNNVEGYLAKFTDNPLKRLNGDQVILVCNLLQREIAGLEIWKIDFTLPENRTLYAKVWYLTLQILEAHEKYQLYIGAFLRISSHPLHLATQANAVRLAVPLGDTDSSLITAKPICDWYYGFTSYTIDQEPVQDLIVYFLCQLFEHFLGMFVAQMGVVPENRELLIMKNEFKMPVLMLTPVAKTYHAYVSSQEGLIFKKPEYELKGARFHASKHNANLIKEFHDLLKRNLGTLVSGEKISRGEVVDIVCAMEEDIRHSIKRKDNPYFLNVKVRDKENYKNPYSQNYAHYVLWNKVFSSRYGEAPELEYTAAKVPLLLETAGQIKAWLATLPTDMQQNYQEWLKECGKGDNVAPTNILVPIANMREYGIPRELQGVVNYKRILADICDPHMLYLQTMGIFLDYKNNEKTLLEIINSDEE